MQPSLFAELVDRSNPEKPVVLRRSPVTVVVTEATLDDITRLGWRIGHREVLGGHQLALGDTVVARDADSDDRWLAQVAHVDGSGPASVYELEELGEWAGPRVWVNGDARWT